MMKEIGKLVVPPNSWFINFCQISVLFLTILVMDPICQFKIEPPPRNRSLLLLSHNERFVKWQRERERKREGSKKTETAVFPMANRDYLNKIPQVTPNVCVFFHFVFRRKSYFYSNTYRLTFIHIYTLFLSPAYLKPNVLVVVGLAKAGKK